MQTASARDSKPATLVTLVVGIQIAVLAAGGAMIYAGTRPPTVTVGPDGVSVRTPLASSQLRKGMITAVSLEPTVPRVLGRSAGFEAMGSLRGYFQLDGLGKGRLFIYQRTPPYVLIRSRDGFTFINFHERERTRALYEQLRAYVEDH